MDSVRQLKESGTSARSAADQANSALGVEHTDMEAICAALSSEFTSASGKTIAITGGAGFLGFYLSKALCFWNTQVAASEQINVILLDAFMRGRPAWIDELEKESAVNVLTKNVIEPVPAELTTAHYIIHAASIASPIYYREHPIETMDANVTGLRNILDFAVERQNGELPLHIVFFHQ